MIGFAPHAPTRPSFPLLVASGLTSVINCRVHPLITIQDNRSYPTCVTPQLVNVDFGTLFYPTWEPCIVS